MLLISAKNNTKKYKQLGSKIAALNNIFLKLLAALKIFKRYTFFIKYN